MHTITESVRNAAVLMAAVALATTLPGCATQGGAGPDARGAHRHGAPAGTAGPDGARMMGGHGAGKDAGAHGAAGGQPMDMQGMCAPHGPGSGAQAAEHRAMMEQHMKDMSPEMRQRHMDMMRQHCGRRSP